MLNTLKKLRNSNKGFTIIEVIIVLAIASMIILVVLLAIPALQRNARNTAIKNDASAVASAVAEYSSNNDGKTAQAAFGTGTISVCDAKPCTAAVTAATAKVQGATVVTSVTGTAPGSPVALTGVGQVKVYFGYRCDNTPSPRASAITYDVETSGAASPKCIDS